MTVTVPPDAGNVGNPPSTCSLCGARMAADQEWCLECGAGRTVIARAPDWRVPVLVVAAVVLVVIVAFVIALTSLSSNAGKVTVIGASTPTSTSAHTQIGSWPVGLPGYTVLLSHTPSKAAADATATKLIADHMAGIGVLATRQHPVMKPANVYYVYIGRYPYLDDAKSEATELIAAGHATAKAALVQKPGGA